MNTQIQRTVSLDLQSHLAELERRGLLIRIDEPIDKDTELHPLVRCQFVGGLPEGDRRAFLFTNVVDCTGKKYDIPVVVSRIRRGDIGSCVLADAGRSVRGIRDRREWRHDRHLAHAAHAERCLGFGTSTMIVSIIGTSSAVGML